MRKSLPYTRIFWQPFSLFNVVLGVIPRTKNTFVEIVAAAKCYFIIAHVKIKKSKKQPFWIRNPLKLAGWRMSVKKGNVCSYLNYNIISLGKMAGKTEPFNYLENLLLFWMMSNKASAHLYTLGNNIYRRKNSPKNIYLFIVNNSNTRKRCETCSKLTIKTRERCSTVSIVSFEHISYLFLMFLLLTLNKCLLGPTLLI